MDSIQSMIRRWSRGADTPHASKEAAPHPSAALGPLPSNPAARGDHGLVSCDYDERHVNTYRGVLVDYTPERGRPRRWRFNSGDFARDHVRAWRFLLGLGCEWGQSSTVARFIVDRNRR